MSQKGFALLTVLIIGLIIVSAAISVGILTGKFQISGLNRSIFQKFNTGNYCELKKGNLCEGEIVELRGKIEAGSFLKGLGYKFTPQDPIVQNEIYISTTTYEGFRLGGGPERMIAPIPFGSIITVKGYVVGEDSLRCTDQHYAALNEKYCDMDSFRIQVHPSSIITEADQNENSPYTIYGKFKDFANAIIACSSPAVFCEDNLGLIHDVCVKVELNKDYCSQLKQQPNMFLISGRAKSLNGVLHPESVLQVDSIGSQNESLETVAGYNKYFLDIGAYAVYNKTGEKIAQVNTGKGDYIEIDNFILTPQGIYYFTRNELYFADKNLTNVQKLGTIPAELSDTEPLFTEFRPINSNRELFFVSHKNNSSREINGNVYYNNTVFLLTIPLNTSGSGDVITPEVLYKETIEGSMRVVGYNPETNSVVVAYSYNVEDQPCVKDQYASINLKTQTKTDLFSLITAGNKYCSETIYNSLFSSNDGSQLVFGADFNNQTKAEKPNRLIIYSISNGRANKKEYVAESSLLRSPNAQVISVNQQNMELIDPVSDNIRYTFPLNKKEYSKQNLESKQAIATDSDDFTKWINNSYQLSGAKYLYSDNNKWYFLVRTAVENKLYIVDNKTREIFLAATFSSIARIDYINKEPVILDTNH